MTTPMTPTPGPYQQFQSFYPPVSSYDGGHSDILAQIYASNQYLTGGLNNLGKEVTQSSLGLRDAVERGNLVNGNAIERTTGDIKLNTTITDAANRQAASDAARDILRTVDANGALTNANVERNGMTNGNAIERNAGNITTAIEKVAGEGRLTTTVVDAASRQAAADTARDILRAIDKNENTTERVGSNLSTSVERNGGNILTAIERVAGEGRMTTTVVDAASRQAANDSARDILGTVERTSAINNNATKDIGTTLLGTVERTAGEIRANFLNAQNTSTQALLDVRHSILNDVNRSTNELLSAGTQGTNVLSKEISNGNWETRNALNSSFLENLKATNQVQLQNSQNFATSMLEQQRSTALLNTEGANRYASTILEGQKSTALLSLDGANQYSSLMMEQQKVKEYLSSKSDSQFAMNQLEMQKVREGLSTQAAYNFSNLQLDQHKIKESIQAQLADAKYDALKNTQFLADKMCECCCEVKQKIDLVDRDRLRDGLVVERTDNNLLKVAEVFDRRFDRFDRFDDRRRSRSRSPPRR